MSLSRPTRTCPRAHRRLYDAARRQCGFSLVEVMVALVVTSIGLLGLAKMESLAVSSTAVAGSRSLAALQASSLAAAMHANTGYWASGVAPASTTVTAPPRPGVVAVASADPVLVSGPPAPCTSVASRGAGPGAKSCTAQQMAAYDLQEWGAALQDVLPGSFSTISCSIAGSPVTCNIQIQWTENAVALNPSQNNLANLQAPIYVLYVQP
jgi:type IV pilus assembly protein PilV